MSLAGKWTELEIKMLSEISQSHKERHYMLLIQGIEEKEKT
jgi:hypothetical protein